MLRQTAEDRMRLLLVNPNMTAAVTESCARVARAVAAPGTEIVPVTGAFGAAIVNTRTENAVAAHALLTLLAKHAGDVDAVLLAVSYDTALMAARELMPVPVVGMTEAGMLTAHLVGSRFGLVVFGTPQLYREMVAERGLTARFAGLRSIDTAATQAYADPSGVQTAVAAAADALAREDGAECVVLCGAAMAGMADKLKSQVGVPLLDGIACGVPLCEMLAKLKLMKPVLGSLAAPRGRATQGLDPALAALLATG
jgi:allantoin racemase